MLATVQPVLRIAGVVAAGFLACACQSTTVDGLHVRAQPTTASAMVASLGPSGTAVTITCFTRGEPVHGDAIWYRISRPQSGWVSNYYVHTDGDVLTTAGSC